MIPYGRQDVTQEDVDSVVSILRSDFLTQGPAVARFEAALADCVSAKHAVAVNSGTSALHVACLALGLGTGEWLWTVPNTFVASANCARYCGASVDFVDIEEGTWNIDVKKLEQKLARARALGRLPKIVVPVHFAGQPPDQEEIARLAREYGFYVLEDASHAIGASRNGEPIGSCRWSDICVFSFHPVKIITTGEGGAATTKNREFAERMAMYRSHGITRDSAKFCLAGRDGEAAASPQGRWYYEQHMLGYNYRMTDLAAALGHSQLQRLSACVKARNRLAERYDEALKELPVLRPAIRPDNRSAFHLYVVRLLDGDPSYRRRVFDELWQQGIGVNVHYLPVHLQPYYRELGFKEGQFPVAEAYANSAITLPLFSAMTDAQQDTVVSALRQAL